MIFNPSELEFVATRAWVVGRTVFMELTDGRQIGLWSAASVLIRDLKVSSLH